MIIEKKYSEKKSLILILLLGFTGLIISFYATQQTLIIYNYQTADPGLCEANTWISCDKAQASSDALFLNIPAAWWGFLFYLWIILSAIWSIKNPAKEKLLLSLSYLITIISMIMVIYKAVIMIFFLKILCPVCIMMYLVNIILLILLWRYVRQWEIKFKEIFFLKSGKENIRVQMLPFIGVALVFGLGFLFMMFYMGVLDQMDLDIDQEVQRFYQQKPVEADLSEYMPMWGEGSSKVNIIVISDFYCPSCRHAAFQLPLLLGEYEEEIRLYFINFPLDRTINPYIPKTIHAGAGLAARAAVCAQYKPGFHEFHNDLFRNPDSLQIPYFLKLAEKRSWDVKEFASCLFSKTSYEDLQKHLKFANSFKIAGTPAVIINGRQAVYWFHPEVLREILEKEIRRE